MFPCFKLYLRTRASRATSEVSRSRNAKPFLKGRLTFHKSDSSLVLPHCRLVRPPIAIPVYRCPLTDFELVKPGYTSHLLTMVRGYGTKGDVTEAHFQRLFFGLLTVLTLEWKCRLYIPALIWLIGFPFE